MDTIEACISSIINSLSKVLKNIIVIDDGSIDGGGELLQSFGNIKIVRHGFIGIAKSINKLLAQIGDDDIVRINGDVIIKTEDWLEEFQKAAYANNQVGIVGARLLLADDRIETDGRNFINGIGYEERHLNLNAFKENGACKKQILEVDSVSSAFCYYKNEVIKKNGYFDENYFPLHAEDDDYCVTARKNNFSVVCNSFIQVYHFISVRTPTDLPIDKKYEDLEKII